MHKKYILIIFSVIFHMSCRCVEYDGIMPHTIDDVPATCKQIVTALFNQPVFSGRQPFTKKKCKVLPLKNYDDAELVYYLTQNGHQRRARLITRFDVGNMVKTNEFYPLKGILFPLYYGNSIPLVDAINYEDVVQRLKSGWVRATLKKYPYIFNVQPESEWNLYIKEELLQHEDVIIKLLARKFNVDQTLICDRTWWKDPSFDRLSGPVIDLHECGPLYMWIKKDKLDKIQAVLKLELNNVQDIVSKEEESLT